jgi:hypothetical protein
MSFPKPLADLLQEGLATAGLAGKLREVDIWRHWPEVVGPVVASRAQPLRIINGTLYVTVTSGPWIQELSFLKGMIKEKLNERLRGEVVREIVLRSGRVAVAEKAPADDMPLKKALTPSQEAYIAQQSAAIVDPEIREAFAALMRASFENGTANGRDLPIHQKQQENT